MFYLVGLGVAWKDISIKALDIIKSADEVLLEGYTSIANFEINDLAKLIKKDIRVLYRNEIEGKRTFINESKKKNIVLLVYGDPLSATTHFEMIQELIRKKIPFQIIHSSSILTLISETGLSLYKFGKTTSIPFWSDNFQPESFFDVFTANKSIKAHTLFLLDLDPKAKEFMSPAYALDILLQIAKKRKSKVLTKKTLAIACSRLGTDKQEIKVASVNELLKKNYSEPPHCLIIPSTLSDSEKEFLSLSTKK